MDKQKLFAYIEKYDMFKKGDIVIAALSGGADSMALFHFLHQNATALGITLYAAHVNHKMRKEADAEAEGVAEYCKSCNIQLFTKTLSPPQNPSEDWARAERYAFFESVSASLFGAKVATAHTSSDNAETLLFRLCRGTALRGAGGIPPVRDIYVRPLLCCTREEIEQYCAQNSISYYIDKTNLTAQYTRGKIRNETFAKLCEVHPAAKKAFARFADCAREAQSFIDEQALALLTNAKTQNGYNASLLCKAHPALCKAAIYIIISQNGKIDEKTVNACYALVFEKSGKVNLPNGAALVLQSGKIRVDVQKTAEITADNIPLENGIITFPQGKALKCEIIEYEEFLNYLKLEKKGLFFCADYGKIPVNTCFRFRKSGDTFKLPARNVTKTVKKLMNEQGVLQSERSTLPLLAADSRVLWLWGQGFCEGLAPSSETKKILIITIICNAKEN